MRGIHIAIDINRDQAIMGRRIEPLAERTAMLSDGLPLRMVTWGIPCPLALAGGNVALTGGSIPARTGKRPDKWPGPDTGR